MREGRFLQDGQGSRRGALRLAVLVLSMFGIAGPLAADPFVNFEDPHVRPMALFRLSTPGDLEPGEQQPVPGTGLAEATTKNIAQPVPSIERRFLAVVNTPDNSIEIYDAHAPWGFVKRLVSGIGPVTVRWNGRHKRLYACNFSGDSVSVYQMSLRADGNLVAKLERIVDVGDQPSDIAFSPDDSTAFVTLRSRAAVTVRNAVDLAEITAIDRLDLTVGTATHAVKAPGQIRVDNQGRQLVLNLMGETSLGITNFDYDLDLYVDDPTTGVSGVSGMGTTHHSFRVSGDKMFVVGTRAQHLEPTAVGVVGVSQQPTGFVQSWLWVLDLPATGAPTVVPEAPAGAGPWPTLQSIDLNRDYTVASPRTAVPPPSALSQPTDLVVLTNDGGVDKLYITAFHSDSIARLRPDANAPGGWNIHRIPVPVLDPAANYSTAGPRGLVLGRNLDNPDGVADTLVFANNRLDNTVVVVSGTTDQIVGHFALQNDPTPDIVRIGRVHLYNAAQTSGSGIVSCASCHVDARTDGLPWNLGGDMPGPSIPAGFHDQNNLTITEFPEDKGIMITQNLLGLVNYPVNEGSQFMFTNAPYHWRGDKPAFEDFNEAFVNLMGAPDIGDPGDPKGLTDAEMKDYRRFIDTLRHPSNPDQDRGRRQTGVLGAEPDDVTASTGTNLGMVIYHIANTVGNRACVDCHSLPESSSNTSTINVTIPRTVTSGADLQHPIETAALRNVWQRERQILTVDEQTLQIVENLQTANFGLMHDGLAFNAPSLETFAFNFLGTMPGPDTIAQILALSNFIVQHDFGIAPSATLAHTLGQANDTVMLDLLEDQVREGNSGLAAYTRSGTTETAYYYDITGATPVYREEGTSNTVTRAALEAQAAAGDTVIFQGCPLGTERRWAALGADPTVIAAGQVPSNITLEPMAPATPWVGLTGLNTMAWASVTPSPPTVSNMWTRQAFQQALIPHPQFGVDAERHEPPRRFRVSGDNIFPGALLHIGMPTQTPQSLPIQVLTLELYPTQYTGTDGRRIWESSEELAPYMTLALLNGGFWAPDVVNTFLRQTTTPNLQPVTWNGYLAVVQNEDGTLSNNLSTFHVLSVQDGR